jgi:hypothetical protein
VESEVPQPDAQDGDLVPVSGQAGGRGIVIPSQGQLTLLREQARAEGKLHDLREQLAALFAVGERFGIVQAELVRLAVARLEVERDIGGQLSVEVRQGRPRKRSPRVTFSSSPLPAGISKQQAMRFRELARVPESLFQDYLRAVAAEGRLPTSSGARRFAARGEPAGAAKAAARPKLNLAPEVVSALARMMVPDVLVGQALVPARRVVSPSQPSVLDDLRGAVMVLDCPDPQAWFEAVADLHVQRVVKGAVLLLPLEVHSRWYSTVVERWLPCWVPPKSDIGGQPLVVVHLGRANAMCHASRVPRSSFGATPESPCV